MSQHTDVHSLVCEYKVYHTCRCTAECWCWETFSDWPDSTGRPSTQSNGSTSAVQSLRIQMCMELSI